MLCLDSLRSALEAAAGINNSVDSGIVEFFNSLQRDKKQQLALCSLCARIGITNSPEQIKDTKEIFSYQGEGVLQSYLQRLENELSAKLCEKSPFLGGTLPNESDILALNAVFPVFS